MKTPKLLVSAATAILMLATSGLARAASVPVSGPAPIPVVTPLPAVGNTDMHFGVVQAFENSGLASRAGARWERAPFFWNLAQPSAPTDWNPSAFQMSSAQLASDIASNLQVVGQIGNPPAWAVKDGSTPKNLNLPWNDPSNYWGQFVYKLAQTYAGQIDTWIIWNEPDYPRGNPLSTWAGTEQDYYLLLKDAYQAAKAANPNVKIVFAGTTYWVDVNAGKTLFFQRVLEAARAADPSAASAGYYFDAVDVHLYSSPLDLYRVPQVYKQIMSNFGISKPIWVTETNVAPYDDPSNETAAGSFRASLSEQANYVIRAFAMALAGGVERISMYKLIDGTVADKMPWGMVRDDGSVRPEYLAYQVAVSHFANADTINYSNSAGVDYVTFDKGNHRTWMLVNTQPADTTVTLPWLSLQATTTTKLGASSTQTLGGLEGGRITPLQITLPGATNGIIGGDPILVEQDRASQAAQPSPVPGAQFFKQTGHNVAFAFLKAYDAFGGAEMLGYPRTEAIPYNGRTIQLFQRAVMEYHPEASGTPGEVALWLVGSNATQGRQFAPGKQGKDDPTHQWFPQTSHTVANAFLKFYNAHGGPAILGYPLSDEMVDVLPDGAVHTVQYFQRGRLEYHPELAGKPGEVSLGLLVDEMLRQAGWLS